MRIIFAFVDPALSAFFLFLFSYFSLGLGCAVCPSGDLTVVLCGCYINIAGRKPVSRRNREGERDVPEIWEEEDNVEGDGER